MERENEANSTGEIEITPAMIEAGVNAFCGVLLDMDPYEEIVCDIYRTMELIRRSTPSSV
jgi:hypothetical protein